MVQETGLFLCFRFLNNEVLVNMEGVSETIRQQLHGEVIQAPHLNPPPRGGRRNMFQPLPQGWEEKYVPVIMV